MQAFYHFGQKCIQRKFEFLVTKYKYDSVLGENIQGFIMRKRNAQKSIISEFIQEDLKINDISNKSEQINFRYV